MGKAADNERIRLRATFYNNLSLAFLIAGLLTPLIALFVTAPPNLYEWLWLGKIHAAKGDDVRQGLAYFAIALISLMAARFYRQKADSTLANIRD